MRLTITAGLFMATRNQLKFKVLWKLYHHHYWGKRHTPKNNLPKGLPPHERGPCLEVVEDLIRDGWLLIKKTKHGEDLSLNPRRANEIKRFLESFEI